LTLLFTDGLFDVQNPTGSYVELHGDLHASGFGELYDELSGVCVSPGGCGFDELYEFACALDEIVESDGFGFVLLCAAEPYESGCDA
jgi:hypothetical protein